MQDIADDPNMLQNGHMMYGDIDNWEFVKDDA